MQIFTCDDALSPDSLLACTFTIDITISRNRNVVVIVIFVCVVAERARCLPETLLSSTAINTDLIYKL